MMLLSSKIPATSYFTVREALERTEMSESETMMLVGEMKDVTLAFLLSVFVGTLGIDRFYIGDIGMGVGKLITGGGCGVWWIIDLVLIMNDTKKKNLEMLTLHLR